MTINKPVILFDVTVDVAEEVLYKTAGAEVADDGQVSLDTCSPLNVCVALGDVRCQSMGHEERYLFQEPNCHFVAA